MANLKEIRNRIESIQSTEQITTAMRMVSASKLRKAQHSFSSIYPYANALTTVSQDMYAVLNQHSESHNTGEEGNNKTSPEHVLFFVFSSNRGLCGPFNINAARYVNELIATEYEQHLKEQRLHLMTAGRRASDIIEKQGLVISETHHELMNNLHYKDVFTLSDHLFQLYQQGVYQKIILVYNKFKTVLSQELTAQQFLPVISSDMPQKSKEPIDFIMEPDKETVLQWLFPKILGITLYRTFLESIASEEGARMTAMQQASDNASVLLKELRVNYNKARQAAITNELLEIIAGSEALNNQ
jgi:F-type H+-transporting ATPase subunit gamma